MPIPTTPPTRDELVSRYLDQLPYEPYKVQEEALLAWFSAEQGVLVCTPTGTGKTLIAEAALFEALHTGTTAYYTTPLIALCEQKFREMQSAAVKWGFQPDDVGLVTGNRRENPDARVLVVVAEILLNRLLHSGKGDSPICAKHGLSANRTVPSPPPTAFDFSQVSAVVMDEFHSFTDPERGIVWELSLGLLPEHVRTLLLSATVGNAVEFLHWLRHEPQPEAGTGRRRRAQGAAEVPLGRRHAADRAARSDGPGRRRSPHDARLGLLLQPRRMLDRGRATQGQAGPRATASRSGSRPNWSGTTGRKGPGRSSSNS